MRPSLLITTAALALAVIAFPAVAEEGDAAELKVGDKAPDFAIPEGVAKDQIGDAKKLSDLQGKKVVLAFYPKAFTPGCTNQMCGYRDEFTVFQDTGTVVLAISVDEQAESNRFKEHHELPFAVVGDPNKEIIKKYGVELLSRNDFEYAKRQTFLIDASGNIAYIDRDYHYAQGKDPLFEAIRKLDEKEESSD